MGTTQSGCRTYIEINCARETIIELNFSVWSAKVFTTNFDFFFIIAVEKVYPHPGDQVWKGSHKEGM